MGLFDSIGSMFGGGGQEQQDSTTEPWKPMQPYMLDAAQQAQNLYNSGGPNYFPNATYTNFSPQSQMAMQLGENRALYGSQFDPMAGNVAMQAMQGNNGFTQAGTGMLQQGGLGMGQLQSTMQGNYLNSNPYLDKMFGAAARGVNQQYQNQVLPGVNATFGSGGRTGSMAHQTGLDMANQSYQNSMTDMAANIYGNNYANERSNQLNAANSMGQMGANLASGYNSLGNSNFNQQMGGANLGMSLGAQDWTNLDRLGQIGGMVENKGQQMLDDQINRFNFYQNRPEQNLQQYTNFLNGNPASSASQTNVDQANGSTTLDIAKTLATMAFLSDVRLKRNIRKIGERSGFNWYSWDWNEKAAAMGLNGSSEGVIAQEVEAIRPDLIGMIGGYKAVNYGGL